MDKDTKITLSVVSGIIVIAILVGLGGGYIGSKALAGQNKSKIPSGVKTSKPLPENTPDMFGGYMCRMQQKIKTNWNPPKRDTSGRVTIVYKIAKNGSLKNYNILKSSGDKQMDNAAIKALKASSPFEPLPEKFSGESVEVQFTFDYNVKHMGNSNK